MFQHLSIQLLSVCYLPVGRFGMLRTKENLKLLALKVVAVAYEKRSLTRGFKYDDLIMLIYSNYANFSQVLWVFHQTFFFLESPFCTL